MVDKIPTLWNGQEYESVEAAALDNYVTSGAMRYRIKVGYTCDEDLDLYHVLGTPVTYKGVHYRSISRCARIHQKSDYIMRKLIEG